MADYISREAALEIVKRTSGDYAAAFSEIRKLPAANVGPVQHGRWVNMGGFTVCSECACSPGFHEPKPGNPCG